MMLTNASTPTSTGHHNERENTATIEKTGLSRRRGPSRTLGEDSQPSDDRKANTPGNAMT
ncbi:hypothetical protein SCATT_04300 [Streptantibioticus cattleyicolor NRRL 8057 = DSM 46488]|uniref:Uncharacterized protein n=1 Tax=Streptantibioticus cattleyicolor (strain ATCC 35852 / DSM 46488 / JCM 4925 / NBRC 14057 / NRRL 8057) TaxID=1003195 RepID=G8WNN9_STREN|nr:hypothetical protein SCATT_04300 [Streptantibioticus cattleyicolor NRRL 8057 = DSM 46488]